MSIIRRKRSDNFTIVPNHIFADERLPFEAAGLLCYLLTRPDDWTVRTDNLQQVTGFGRDKCQRLMRWIIDAGYARRETIIDPQTRRYEGQELIIYDESYVTNPEPENQVVEPEPEIPADGKSGSILRTERYQELNLQTRARATRIREDWLPSEADRAFARNEGLSETQVSREAARFRDHWRAQPGQRGVKLDWPATWRNWIRKASEIAPKAMSQAPPGRKQSYLDAAHEIGFGYDTEGRKIDSGDAERLPAIEGR